MNASQIIHLLVANQSPNEAENVANLFRNAGYPVRGQPITSAEQLERQLQEESWDLLLVHSQDQDLELGQLQHILSECKRPPTVVLISDEPEAKRELALQYGFADVVPAGKPDWLLHVCQRELRQVRALQRQGTMKAELDELKARYDLLLASASDAIAYAADGLHINVNNAYAEIFGYNADEMTIITLMDLIADDEQERFKQFLKAYNCNPEQAQAINITGVRRDGQHVALTLQLSHAQVDGEECTQIIASPADAVADDGQSIAADTALFLKQIKHAAARARSRESDGALICIQPWNFWQTRNTVGLLNSGRIVQQLGRLISESLPADCHVAQLAGDFFFATLPDCGENEAVSRAEDLAQAIQQHIFEVDQQTVSCEVRLGVVMFSRCAVDMPERMVDYTVRGLSELAASHKDDVVVLYEPPEEPVDVLHGNVDLEELSAAGNIKLLFQPIMGLRGDTSEYYEVLVHISSQYDDPAVDPELVAQKLATAEGESPFDQWLLFECIKKLSQQKAQGKSTSLVVPLSSQAVKDKRLASWLLKTMKDAGIGADKIVIELPEEAVSRSLKMAADLVARLYKYKVRSCLSGFRDTPDAVKALQHVRTRWVKLHPELALKNGDHKQEAAQLKQLIAQATNAGAASLVPDVASAAMLATLWQAGASYIQGSYLQGPSEIMNYEFAEIA